MAELTGLVPLSAVSGLLPNCAGGRAISKGTIFRWARCGVHGVRLHCVRVGQRLYTSPDMLQEFIAALNGAE